MKTKTFLLVLIFIFALTPIVFAQTQAELDENVTAQDLGISQPKVLSGSPFYFFKNIGRGLMSAFTFDPIKKAELKLKFANEKIIETKILAERTEKPETLKKALDNYNQELKQLENAVQKIKAEQPEKIDEFLNKFVDNQIKHQKLIGKFEKEMPQEILGTVASAKTKSLEQLSTLPLRFEEPQVFQERIEKIIEEQPGSEFKNFKNLEVLKEVEQKVPEQAKPAIQQAQVNVLKRLEADMAEKTAPSQPVPQQEFIQYAQEIGGNKQYQQEIITKLQQRGQIEIPIDIIEIPKSAPSAEKPATPKGVPDDDVMPGPCMTQVTCAQGYTPYDTGQKDEQNCPIIECKCEGYCNKCGCPKEQECINTIECRIAKPISCQTNFKMANIYLFMKDDSDSQINLERLNRAKNTYEQVMNIAGRDKLTFDLSYPIFPIEINATNKDKLLFTSEDGKLYLQLPEITKEFYKSNPDNFDFINIFYNFFISDEPNLASAGHIPIKAFIKNIGGTLCDYSKSYGSKRLLGVNELVSTKIVYSPENLAEFSEEQIACMTAVGEIVHETTHQWSAYIGDTYDSGGDLILQIGGHWFQGLDLNYDPVGGGKWKDNGDGTFTLVEHDEHCAPRDLNVPERYGIEKMSDLTLYLVGAIEANQVKPILWIDYNGPLTIGTTVKAESKYITIEDIIARHGERACLDFGQ